MSIRTAPQVAARRASSLEGVLRAGVRAREAPTGMVHAGAAVYTPGFVLITWSEIDLSNANMYSRKVSDERGGGILVPTSQEVAETSGKTFTLDDLNILGLVAVPNTESGGWVRATASQVLAKDYAFYVHEFTDTCLSPSENPNAMNPCEVLCTKYKIWVDLGGEATPSSSKQRIEEEEDMEAYDRSMDTYIKEQAMRQNTEVNKGKSRAGDAPTLSNDEAAAMMERIHGGGGGGGGGGKGGGGKQVKWNGYGGGGGRGRGSYRGGGRGGWRGKK